VSLQKISLQRLPAVTTKGLQLTKKNSFFNTFLESVDFSYFFFSESGSQVTNFISFCKAFSALQEIFLDHSKIDSSNLKDLFSSWPATSSLKLISLKSCRLLTGLALCHLHNSAHHLTQLEKVFFDCCPLMEIKVEMSRLLNKNSFKSFDSISFAGCPLLTAESLCRYLSIPSIQQNISHLSVSYLTLNEQTLNLIRSAPKFKHLAVDLDSSSHLAAVTPLLLEYSSENV
jgi:hypothetical protein